MRVKYCCLDASAFSLGFASSHGGTLILEKTENVLSDYVAAVTPGTVTQPRTAAGEKFAGYLRKAGCVSAEGVLDAPSLAPAAAEYALDMGFNVLLGVRVVSRDGGNVRIYTNGGLTDIVCDRVIRRPEADGNEKWLNCVVSGVGRDTLSVFERSGGRVRQSFEKDEFIVSLPFAPGCRYNEARIEFVRRLRDCFGTSVKIDAFASDFEYGGPGRIIEEFEAGVNYALL